MSANNAVVTQPQIIFLDIDGVVLPWRAHILPENLALARKAADLGTHSTGELARSLRFDPVAMALVNRLGERTGAKIVVHSNWRRNVGTEQTRIKLLDEGLEERHLHADWACGWRFSSEKCHDISQWLSGHRVTPEPSQPRVNASAKSRDVWYRALRDYGIRYVVLDDEKIHGHDDVQVEIDGREGLLLATYRHACGYLDGADDELGVSAVSAEDMARVTAAWGDDRFRAAGWLHHAPTNGIWSQARRLDARPDTVGDAAAFLLGCVTDPVKDAEKRRDAVFKNLEDDTAHLRRRARCPRTNNDF